MKIQIELDVKFDDGYDGFEVDSVEVGDCVAEPVSGCVGIENVGSVEIEKVKIKW